MMPDDTFSELAGLADAVDAAAGRDEDEHAAPSSPKRGRTSGREAPRESLLALRTSESSTSVDPHDTAAAEELLVAVGLRAPRVTLVRVEVAGSTLMVGERPVVIGRSEEHADAVVADRMVSRQHLRLERLEDRFVATDLGSSNGTWLVRGGTAHELVAPVVVEPGDRLRTVEDITLAVIGARS